MGGSLRRAGQAAKLLSGAGLTRRGDRVAVRPLREGELLALESWYGGAGELGGRLDEAGVQALAIVRRGRRRPIGVVTYGVKDGSLWFEFVGLESESRGRGLGTEAVRLVEAAALVEGLASRFWADVPKGDGLAFYFWLRLGYTPARTGEVPSPGVSQGDIIGMVRRPGSK